MKNQLPNQEKKVHTVLKIEIPAADWQVDPAVLVNICQQPAKNLPFPLPAIRRVPRFDVWQLGDFFPNYNQSLI